MIKADLLLPVYNSPNLLLNFLESLVAHTDPDQVNELLVGDDGSDPSTQSVIESFRLRSSFRLRVITNKQNVGFVKNCNRLFNASSADVCILINSDILVPKNWLPRMLQPFETDIKIALATPFSTSAANLTVRIPSGHSWVDLDHIFNFFQPTYPEACTAVGFCLAIRRLAIDRPSLFDEVFGLGYGEESDLHYHLKSLGYRSVIVDHLLVHHLGSGSFFQLEDLNAKRKANFDFFMERWGKTHLTEIKKFSKNKDLLFRLDLKLQTSKWMLDSFEYDVLFVLPAMIEKSGGISVVVELVEKLNAIGYKANIFVTGVIDKNYVEKFHSFNPIRLRSLKNIKKCKLVFSTHYNTVLASKKLSQKLNAKYVYFVQGPEGMFNNAQFFETVTQTYSEASDIICVSEYLHKYLQAYSDPRAKIKNISWGPSPLVYYSKNKTRQPKSIAGCLRTTVEKGSCYLLNFLYLAKKQGYQIHLFGKECGAFELPQGFATLHGDLDSHGMATLFNQVEFYADFSFYEGLGLIPLEAAFCGAVPIITQNGGSNTIFNSSNSILVTKPVEPNEAIQKLLCLSSTEVNSLSASAEKLSLSYSSLNGFKAFQAILEGCYAVKPLGYVFPLKLVATKSEMYNDRKFILWDRANFELKIIFKNYKSQGLKGVLRQFLVSSAKFFNYLSRNV